MFEYPNILKNPFDPIYRLKDHEMYSIKECDELISLKKYTYALFGLWNASIINLQRRIEYFGIDIFLNILEEKEQFNKNGKTLKDRWLNINEHKILDYAKKLNILNHISYEILNTLFWMKSSTNEQDDNELTEEEVISMVYLVERKLLLKKFKEDLRGKNPAIKNTKLKFRRKEDMITDENAIPSTYHNLLMKSGVKIFEENKNPNNPNNNLIDKYC